MCAIYVVVKVILSRGKTSHCCIRSVFTKFVDRKLEKGRRRKHTQDTPIAKRKMRTRIARPFSLNCIVSQHKFTS